MSMLMLFQEENCLYCAKVRAVMTRKSISYVSVNSVSGSPARAIQLKLGGVDQVPFLVDIDKGITMYESDDIISYLDTTYAS